MFVIYNIQIYTPFNRMKRYTYIFIKFYDSYYTTINALFIVV
ncbi:hypothetical protein BCA_A0165 (plasmid) [Bacillus cereus 03BB102]|uniref:Uncharacterized protein n=1 Tax=Bacillus cereus (strain 03BB102) TaxID=572264 RepID=A0A125Y9R3_BACC3|nr:hypothetical protein BCA_A0165 [Bacillus cereus 03BB102]ACQ50997.1 hypothetical protein BAA_A0184 [Bacillus anthracis str. A0248]EDT17005.1 hypothetical protein BAM_A0162 [Bacillus anthracis str. A0465]EDV13364.1 hypothetical protein BATI_B0184 [Bacillus anthracis str. Tsiankovskii-I]